METLRYGAKTEGGGPLRGHAPMVSLLRGVDPGGADGAGDHGARAPILSGPAACVLTDFDFQLDGGEQADEVVGIIRRHLTTEEHNPRGVGDYASLGLDVFTGEDLTISEDQLRHGRFVLIGRLRRGRSRQYVLPGTSPESSGVACRLATNAPYARADTYVTYIYAQYILGAIPQ